MNERDIELAAEAEAYADYNFKGEVYWREAYESRLIELIRADERERIKAANAPEIERINAHLKSLEDAVKEEREACAKLVDPTEEHRQDAAWGYLGGEEGVVLLDLLAEEIRARGNT
jgi:hypothetical protein